MLLTTTQTQDLDMISQAWVRQCQHRRREKHSLVIGMRNEQADALVAQLVESAPRNAHGVDPAGDCQERDCEDCSPLHDWGIRGRVACAKMIRGM